MNPKTLDALLLDRAAGALSPDVAQLLDAYIAQDPNAALRGLRYSATVSLIRAAMPPAARDSDLRVPAFPSARIKAARSRRRVLAILRPIAMAAVIAIAFVLGGKLAAPADRPGQVPLVLAEATSAGGFWAYPAAPAATPNHRPARTLAPSSVRWSSPLRWPQPGGSS